MASKQQNLSPREQAQQRCKNARSNLLLMIVLTVVNIVLLFAGSDSMMLFSASIPYFSILFGMVLQMQELLIAGCVVAGILIVLYVLCWLFSKKHYGWLVSALVLFILDTLGMAGFYLMAEDVSGIMDVLMHIWVLYYLILGISSGRMLKKLPEEEIPVPAAEEPAVDSVPLRRIGEDEKSRILLESTYGTYRVCYRRVKRTNQLVINGYIYDEIEMLIETAHCLSARMDGHLFEVGFDDRISRSYFRVDGKEIAKKMRWY